MVRASAHLCGLGILGAAMFFRVSFLFWWVSHLVILHALELHFLSGGSFIPAQDEANLNGPLSRSAGHSLCSNNLSSLGSIYVPRLDKHQLFPFLSKMSPQRTEQMVDAFFSPVPPVQDMAACSQRLQDRQWASQTQQAPSNSFRRCSLHSHYLEGTRGSVWKRDRLGFEDWQAPHPSTHSFS